MSIDLHCEKCGHHIRAKREAAGKWAKCPNCQSQLYIPTPEEDLEELPLAPEDSTDLQHEQELQAERRRLDRALSHEHESIGESLPPPARSGKGSTAAKRTSVKGVVMTYLTAMRDSDFDKAQTAIQLLATQKAKAIEVIDALAADQIPPAEMTNVPAGVYQGFLKNLRSQL